MLSKNKVNDLEREREEDDKRHRKRIEEITTDFVKEKQEMLYKFDEYRKIFIEELRVRQLIIRKGLNYIRLRS